MDEKDLKEYYNETEAVIKNELEILGQVAELLKFLTGENTSYMDTLRATMEENKELLAKGGNQIFYHNPFKDSFGSKEKAHLRRCIEVAEVKLRQARLKLDRGRVK